jgi:nitrilase
VWGQGDASGLRVTDTAVGRVGSLICWENYMPLARYALYADGVETYVAATWDEGDTWIATMRHIAAEGRCWVIGAGCSLRGCDVPAGFPGREQLFPDPGEWLNPGDSVVVAPGGAIVAGPLHEEHGLLYADVEPARVAAAHPRRRRPLQPQRHFPADHRPHRQSARDLPASPTGMSLPYDTSAHGSTYIAARSPALPHPHSRDDGPSGHATA